LLLFLGGDQNAGNSLLDPDQFLCSKSQAHAVQGSASIAPLTQLFPLPTSVAFNLFFFVTPLLACSTKGKKVFQKIIAQPKKHGPAKGMFHLQISGGRGRKG